MVRVREVVFAVEFAVDPVVTPSPIDFQERGKALAIPFEHAGVGRMFRRHAFQCHALGERKEMAAFDRERAPLLRCEGGNVLHRHPLVADPFINNSLAIQLVRPFPGSNPRGREKAPLSDLQIFGILAAWPRDPGA